MKCPSFTPTPAIDIVPLYHVQIDMSVKRHIIWGTSVHNIPKGGGIDFLKCVQIKRLRVILK
jgi:hypothetical protein